VPGLIDTHVHYALGGDEAMKLFIANGVTSVRDCGGQLELLKAAQHAISSGEKIGPRLYICGPLLQGRVPALPEPYNSLLAMSVNSPDEVPDKIGAVLGAEVDSLKLYYSLPTETGERVIGYAGGESTGNRPSRLDAGQCGSASRDQRARTCLDFSVCRHLPCSHELQRKGWNV
jgi:hypothetical protein